jgi:apolipoprotein N-acyltransferase
MTAPMTATEASTVRERLRPAVLGALFVLLYPLGMPGYDLPGLPFVCLAPLLALAAGSRDARQAAYRCFLAGTAASLLLYYWIAYTVAVKGNLGWAAGVSSAVAVSAYLGVYVSVSGWAAHRLERRWGEAGLLFFPLAWTGLEYLRSVLLSGFPWMLLGYGLSGSLFLRQAADLAGVYGLGFLLALCAVFLYGVLRRLETGDPRRALARAGAAAAVPAFLLVYGQARVGTAPAGTGEAVRVGIAQGGIDQSVKWDPAYQQETVDIYRRLTREAVSKGAQVVVWPETAAPFFYGWEREMSRQIDNTAAESGAPLVFGAPWFEPGGGEGPAARADRYYNSVFLLGADGVPRARYDKKHLVPFGEYVPMRKILFFVSKLTEAGEGDFSSGTGSSLFPVGGEKAGISVCYEAVFPGIIGNSVREGATFLVNVTNDAWFGDTVAPRQHLAMARMRSVEFRRPLVRAANAGISAVVDARGELSASLGLFRQGVVEAPVRPARGLTPYAKSGDTFAVTCTIISCLISFISLRGTDGVRTARGKGSSAGRAHEGPPGLSLK